MKILNKKARFKYELFDRLEAGIVLSGAEVKSVKNGRLSLAEAYVKFREGEVWLVGANIAPYPFADNRNYDPTRTRKLLLKKKEIIGLVHRLEAKNQVLVPVVAYSKKGRVKLELALARPKKLWQKKEAIKKRDIIREMERETRR